MEGLARRSQSVSETTTISWTDFEKVQICAGTVLRVEEFPEARKPAWKLWVDFGPLGVKKTSAQVKALYSAGDLVGRQILGHLPNDGGGNERLIALDIDHYGVRGQAQGLTHLGQAFGT